MPLFGAGGGPSRPRRAKSTASIKYHQNTSEDSEALDQYALTAAALAFERANGRAGGPRHKTNVAGMPNPNKPSLERKQSVRFVGPTAKPTELRPITRRNVPGHDSQKCTSEAECLDSEATSMQSSYKRVRKTKSMHSPRNTLSLQFTHSTPQTTAHTRSHSEQSTDSVIHLNQLPKPSLQRSFSFLRGKTDHISPNSRQNASTDEAIQMARDQYLRQLNQQGLQSQPSTFAPGKRPKSQKAFRRTVRSGSTNSYGGAIASATSNTTEPSVAKGLGDRARIISFSLRDKLKRVFHRPSDTPEAMPAQHLNASRPHFGDYMAASSGLEQRYEGIPSPDGETLLRASSRVSPLRNSPVFCDTGSLAGSIRSTSSDDSVSNARSRVSSWTNSTAANTLSLRQKRERKRLSVIQENGGPHEPSSSAEQCGEFSDGNSIFRNPIQKSSLAGRTRGLVDSQRIFSALQKRLGEKSQQASDQPDHKIEDSLDQAKFHLSDLTPRRSSINNHRDRPGSTKTRNAQSSPVSAQGTEALKSSVSKYFDSDDMDDVFSPIQIMSSSERQGTDIALTLQEASQRGEVDYPTPKRPLRELKSGFFPSNMRLERSNVSPFRRGRHVNSETETGNSGDIQSTEQPIVSARPQTRPSMYKFHNGSVIGSESVYSRTSSGNTPNQTNSSLSLAKSESSGEVGTLAILASKTKNYRVSNSPVAERDLSLAKSSGDWQNWMASHVATLENGGTANTMKDAYFATGKRIGHKRENALFDEEDLAPRNSRHGTNEPKPKQSHTTARGNSMARPALEHKSSYSMIDRFPLIDIAPTSNVSTLRQDKSSSNEPHNVQARLPMNVENERHQPSIPSASGIHGKVSSVSLRSQPHTPVVHKFQTKSISFNSPGSQGTLATPNMQGKLRIKTKPVTPSRHSPERLARLRRMRSSTSVELAPSTEPRSSSGQSRFKVTDPNIQGTLPGLGLEWDVSGSDTNITPTESSQKIVDLFLNNRRRNMTGSDDSDVNLAFL